jgi:hypothetical protein
MPRVAAAIVAILGTAGLACCAGPSFRPDLAPAAPRRDALLILPGFGYGRHDASGFRSIKATAAADGIDIYVSSYLTRTGLDSSRDALLAYIRGEHLDRYERLHVFAFIAGGWTLNAAVTRDVVPNLATVIYDRSPFQERAPEIAVSEMPVRAWLRYGFTIFDLAKTPYTPMRAPGVQVALLVETLPTLFIRHHATQALARGPFDPGCSAFTQPYDDCAFVAMTHDDLYPRFPELWPDVESFIRTGRFTASAVRTPPSGGTLTLARR